MNTAYDYGLVALSIVVAMIAAYVSVDLAARVRTAPEAEKTDWLVAGAVVMGVGIWAMHFVGMLALQMPMRLGYDVGTTVVSILPAIIAAGCALNLIQRPVLTAKHRLVGGLIMGSGIGAMHYTGMAAMVMSPPSRYDLVMLAASVVFAVAGSALTIHLAHRAYAAATDAAETRLELISAVVGGLAIAGMHYLGMAATVIAPNSVCLSGFQGLTLPHHYNPWLVAMSVAIAIMSSYTALDVAARMRVAKGKRQYWWLIGGGFSMGLGIWSMHFIGMIAMHTERPVTYELWTTLLSFVPAFAASTFALYMIQRGVPRPRILGLSGLLMGSGIGAMHYIGMAAMQIEPPMRYDPTFFTLSLLVAIAASVSALWIGFQHQQHGDAMNEVGLRKVISALIMGLAIAGMHYTGMSATHILPPSASNQLAIAGLDPDYIAVFVGVAAFIVLLITYMVAFYDARVSALRARIATKLQKINTRLEQQAKELAERVAAETLANTKLAQALSELKQREAELRIAAAAFKTQSGIIITDANEVIIRVNEAFTRITGHGSEVIGKTPSVLHSEELNNEFYQALLASDNDQGYWEGELWLTHVKGKVFPVWETISAVTGEDGNITQYVASFMDITAHKQAEKILLEARERLESQVATTQEELEKTRAETDEINTALDVLLNHREKDMEKAKISLTNEVEAVVMPLLKRLKNMASGQVQTLRMVGTIEDNLMDLMQTYGRTQNLDAAYQKLSPVECQVAAMVKRGQPTKVIAAALNSSPQTVETHRRNIRKKLKLDTKTNLFSYLQSLQDTN